MSSGVVTDKVLEHGRITSLKGIPRLLRTKSPFMRFVWSVSFVCFLALAAGQGILLTISYFQFSTVISIRETPLELTDSSPNSIQAPDITFCNINPFASNFTADTHLLSVEDFLSMVRATTQCDDCTKEEEISMMRLRDELLSSRGYYIQIGGNSAQRISHSKESLIASCHVWFMSGLHPTTLPCEAVVTVNEYQDSMYYNCYTIRGSKLKYKESIYFGLIVIFHLDMYGISKYPIPLAVHPQMRYLSGMSFNFHEHGSVPVFVKEQSLIQSGLFTDIKIRAQRHKRLSEPYGQCVEHAAEDSEYTVNGTYSQLVCYSLCKQTVVFDTCGCIDYNNFVSIHKTTNQRACFKMNLGRAQVMKDWTCVQNARAASALSCMDRCPLPCNEVKFETKVHKDYCAVLQDEGL